MSVDWEGWRADKQTIRSRHVVVKPSSDLLNRSRRRVHNIGDGLLGGTFA